MTETLGDTDRRVDDAPVASQGVPKRAVRTDKALSARLSPSTDAIITDSSVRFLRGHNAFTVTKREMEKLVSAWEEWLAEPEETM
jgi:hypothetical protein